MAPFSYKVRGTLLPYQALHHLQQLLHHYGDALIAEQPANGLEVGRAHKVAVESKYAAVCQVQGLCRERGGGTLNYITTQVFFFFFFNVLD